MVSCRSWTLRICFAVRSCRSLILIFHFTVVSCGSWTSRTCFAVRSCRSSIMIFHFIVVSCLSWTLRICFAVRSCRSWILIFHFAVVSCGSWTFENLFCREILQILDLEISFCRRILWILDPIFWSRHKSAWGQILTLTFQGQIIHGSTRLDETNTIGSQSLFYLLKQRRYRRNTIFVKFDLLTSGDFNFDLSLKMTEVVSAWFLPSFRTFCSTTRSSRDSPGVFKHPTPIRWWKIQRPTRARGCWSKTKKNKRVCSWPE